MSTNDTDIKRLEAIAATRPETRDVPRVWRDKLVPELEAREAVRTALLRSTYIGTLLGGVLTALATAIFFAFTRLPLAFNILFAAIIGYFILMYLVGMKWVKVFSMKSQSKTLIVSAACELFGFEYDTLHADLEGITRLSELKAARKAQMASRRYKPIAKDFFVGKLYEQNPPTPAYDRLRHADLLSGYNQHQFEDLIQGTRAGAAFSLHEAKLESANNKGRQVVFQGLLFHIQCPAPFAGRIVMARKGFLTADSWPGGLTRVALVSKELEDAFTVFSRDRVEARALLTPDRMERLIALERHFKGSKLRGVFENGQMTIALEAHDQFEAGSIYTSLANPARFTKTLEQLGLVCDLIDGFLDHDWTRDRIDVQK